MADTTKADSKPLLLLDRQQVRKLTRAIMHHRARNEVARAQFIVGALVRHAAPVLARDPEEE